jgi:hypothetical protein
MVDMPTFQPLTAISPLLSQTRAPVLAGQTNPGRANPKVAGDSRVKPTDTTTAR